MVLLSNRDTSRHPSSIGVHLVSTLTDDTPAAGAALLDVNAVADLLGCSPRHVYRFADGGRMPRPVKLGALARWRRSELDKWIAGGCRPVK